ncbi:MAG: GNAT family N-acetyltransferase [Gaiellaceae bacterium]|jgi:ribosomal protein S18 acetylase RimI-like enzyme
MEIEIRHARPSDYGRIYPLVNEWWGGREMTQHLAGVFFVHFEGSSFVAETADGDLAGFLCGFLSQTDPSEAYVHMIGVAPELRHQGIGRKLYDSFFETAREHGRSHVHFITAPFNSGSIAFHEKLGFELERVLDDYAGPGEGRLLFAKQLT